MKEKIIIAGYGGQGVVVAGSLLANTAIYENKHITGMVSYGAEMRGGAAYSAVMISDKPIGSPIIVTATSAIIMNQVALDKFENDIEKNGLLIINSSMIERKVKRTDLRVVEIDATKIADGLGNPRIANIVMVGAFIKKTGILRIDSVLKNIEVVLHKVKPELIELNKKALIKGAEAVN